MQLLYRISSLLYAVVRPPKVINIRSENFSIFLAK